MTVAMVAAMMLPFFVSHAQSVFTPTRVATEPVPSEGVSDLEDQLRQKRAGIEAIQKKIKEYQNTLERERGKTLTLQNQLAALETRIRSAKLKIEEAQIALEANALERKKLDATIRKTKEDLQKQKDVLAAFLRMLAREADESLVEVLLNEATLSSSIDAIQGNQTIQEDMRSTIDRIETLLGQYQLEQAALSGKHLELAQLERGFKDRTLGLENEEITKQIIVSRSRDSERRFQQFLQQARAEELDADREIRGIENTIRARLRQKGLESKISPEGSVSFIWPVPNQGISAYFYDPDYPFRRIFEHPAIDIRTLIAGRPSNGMPVRAAASGYVARARDGGMGYSYIMLIHGGDYSTVYGHLSRLDVVQDEFVTQGQVIGLSGGQPGTPGAGTLTTGSHLHFEVRRAGIPVNPFDYLP